MSAFEVGLLIGVGMIALALVGIASALEKVARQMGNVADRLLDIDRTMNGRR